MYKGVEEMFTRVRLKNYKSLTDVDINLLKGNSVKNLILIYGENGAGKSNIASAFMTLTDITNSMVNYKRFNELFSEEENNEFIKKIIHSNFKTTNTIIRDSKTVDSTENMVLDYEFEINKKKGRYLIETNDFRIVKEELYYVIEKNKGIFYKLEENKEPTLNTKIFKDKEYLKEIKNNIDKFWGKNTLLSLINLDIFEYNKEYFNNKLSDNIFDIIKFIQELSYNVKTGENSRGQIPISHRIFSQLAKGKIPKKEKQELDSVEEFLNETFTNLYADVKRVYYERKDEEDCIVYNLIFSKMIGGKIRDVKFEMESTGTQKILSFLPALYEAVRGKVTVIDEFDTGIHDLLVMNIISSVNQYIKGQLIMTTHNTSVMECEIDRNSLYFINIDENGNKEVVCLQDYDKRTHPNNNIRTLYMKGVYNGIPITRELDFAELESIMEK